MKGRVLIIAGSDSGGGAGIQADLKTVTALRGYGATAITALTAQNTLGVFGVVPVDPAFIVKQIEVVLEDIGADAIKTGMLHSAPVIEAVAGAVARNGAGIPLVVDPVMVTTTGASLLEEEAVVALRELLLPRASVLTPNLPEAEKLCGHAIKSADEMRAAAQELLSLGPQAVLLKGGHMEGDELLDVLATAEGVESFASRRIHTQHTHGTGCTLASAIATGLAQGLPLREAVVRARGYLQKAIAGAPGFGQGHGPIDHGHTVRPFAVKPC